MTDKELLDDAVERLKSQTRLIMQLTRIEQEKIQSYVIKNMIENQQAIRNQFVDTSNELTFIDYMIEKNYKQAFDLCCAVF